MTPERRAEMEWRHRDEVLRELDVALVEIDRLTTERREYALAAGDEYTKVLRQRDALLRVVNIGKTLAQSIEVWSDPVYSAEQFKAGVREALEFVDEHHPAWRAQPATRGGEEA